MWLYHLHFYLQVMPHQMEHISTIYARIFKLVNYSDVFTEQFTNRFVNKFNLHLIIYKNSSSMCFFLRQSLSDDLWFLFNFRFYLLHEYFINKIYRYLLIIIYCVLLINNKLMSLFFQTSFIYNININNIIFNIFPVYL